MAEIFRSKGQREARKRKMKRKFEKIAQNLRV